MLSTGTDSQVQNPARKAVEDKVTAEVTAEVTALDNLTDAQRELVLGIALGYARNHGTRVVDGRLLDVPHYQNIANHVRFNNPKV
jgi:hypothetical protein